MRRPNVIVDKQGDSDDDDDAFITKEEDLPAAPEPMAHRKTEHNAEEDGDHGMTFLSTMRLSSYIKNNSNNPKASSSSLTFRVVTRAQTVRTTRSLRQWGSVGWFPVVKTTSGYMAVVLISIGRMPFRAPTLIMLIHSAPVISPGFYLRHIEVLLPSLWQSIYKQTILTKIQYVKKLETVNIGWYFYWLTGSRWTCEENTWN